MGTQKDPETVPQNTLLARDPGSVACQQRQQAIMIGFDRSSIGNNDAETQIWTDVRLVMSDNYLALVYMGSCTGQIFYHSPLSESGTMSVASVFFSLQTVVTTITIGISGAAGYWYSK